MGKLMLKIAVEFISTHTKAVFPPWPLASRVVEPFSAKAVSGPDDTWSALGLLSAKDATFKESKLSSCWHLLYRG